MLSGVLSEANPQSQLAIHTWSICMARGLAQERYVIIWRTADSSARRCFSPALQLIAPDIILTAAHCFDDDGPPGTAMVGCYNITDPTEEGAEVHIFQQVVTHPHYYEPVRDDFVDLHDYALIKIYDTSKVGPVIRLNRDASVPDSTPEVPLHVLGWGRTNYSVPESTSDVLKEADVSFIPNNVCKQISVTELGPSYSIENRVFDISLCAADFQDGDDTCYGDSGGPIFLAGENAEQDIQLGTTSWGATKCGHPEIPAIYARVSYVHDWIRENVCRMSLKPPSDFDCESPVSSTEPELSGDMVTVTLEFLIDNFANETGWIVQSPDENGVMVTYAYAPIRTYSKDTNQVATTFSLPNNRYYVLTMLDSSGNGYSGTGDFVLKLTTDKAALVDESLPFENYTVSFDFVLGTLPTASPTATPAPTSTIPPTSAPTVTPLTIWIVIEFDVRPEETGWRIEALYENGETMILKEVFPGTYISMTNVSEPFHLLPQQPMAYRFTLTDNEANGVCCAFGLGSYELWLGEPGAGELLMKGQEFGWEISHEFVINGTLDDSTSNAHASTVYTSSASCHDSVLTALMLAAMMMLPVPILWVWY